MRIFGGPRGDDLALITLVLNVSSPDLRFFLFILIVVNKIASRVLSKKLFSRSELLMIYVIISTALAFTAHGNMVCLMGVLPYSTFFATAENDWINLFYQHLPDWLVIRDDKAVYYFYKGESAFWSTGFYQFWIKPAIAWSFLISLIFLCFFASVLSCGNSGLKANVLHILLFRFLWK